MLPTDAHKILASTGWLARVPADFREAIVQAGRLRAVSPGEVFNIAGDDQGGFWGVVHGQVALTSAMNGVDTPIGLLHHPGDWGGFAPLFGFPRQANVQARSAAAILFIPDHAIRRLLTDNPGWWEHVGRACFESTLQFASWGVDLMLRDSRTRAAAILLHQGGRRFSGDQPVTLALTQEELGMMVNLSRHPMGALLRQFEADGLVLLAYRQITLQRPQALRAIANGS